MPYQRNSIRKTSSNNVSTGEHLASGKGTSIPAVPALQRQQNEEAQLKKEPAQRMGIEEEEPLQGRFDSLQKMSAEEEEPLQGKFTTQLQAEEEEPLQGKFDPIQKMAEEEEEPLQGKFTTQLQAEEEEPLQGKFDPVQKMSAEEEEPLQGKFITQLQAEEEEPLQGKFDTVPEMSAEEEGQPLQGKFQSKPFQFKDVSKVSGNSILQLKEDSTPTNRTGLPDNLKSGVENLSGLSMDDVKVHYNSDKPKQLQAHAYAQGTDIHIAPGQEKHLPHEAWHVAQQKQGRVAPTIQMKSKVPVNDDPALEREADVMGEKALTLQQKKSTDDLGKATISNETAQLKWIKKSGTMVVWDAVLGGLKWFYDLSSNKFFYQIQGDPGSFPQNIQALEGRGLDEGELDGLGFQEIDFAEGDDAVAEQQEVQDALDMGATELVDKVRVKVFSGLRFDPNVQNWIAPESIEHWSTYIDTIKRAKGKMKVPFTEWISKKQGKSAKALDNKKPIDITDESKLAALWGDSGVFDKWERATTISQMFTSIGYAVTGAVESDRTSSKTPPVLFDVTGHPLISKFEIHPGGGIHKAAYIRISTNKGMIKIINSNSSPAYDKLSEGGVLYVVVSK